ncbi:DNA-packaging protein [Staphylococcus sp. HMSC056G08]|nr:DNA-packaging protein [Staphylococcus sp. HMSC056G08]
MRIEMDFDLDDNYIMGVLLPSAINEVKGAVSTNKEDEPFFENNSTFNLLVLNIMRHHYENPSTTSQFQKFEVPTSSLSLIQRLRGDLAVWRLENLNTESESMK